MRLRANPDATLRKTLTDCLFIAQRCKMIVLIIVGDVDMAIGPTSDVAYLHKFYSKQILDRAKKRGQTKQLQKRLLRVLKVAA